MTKYTISPEGFKDMVAYEIAVTLPKLGESDYAHKMATWQIFDTLYYDELRRHKSAVVAGGIMNLAFQVYPDNYDCSSKPVDIMWATGHRANYTPILHMTKKLKGMITTGDIRRDLEKPQSLEMKEGLLEETA